MVITVRTGDLQTDRLIKEDKRKVRRRDLNQVFRRMEKKESEGFRNLH
jgi:hypothetical protein